MTIFARKIIYIMKTLRSIFLAAMLSLSGTVTGDNFAYLTISQSGSDTNFEVSQISRITFDEQNMILHLTNNTTQQLPLASLSKMFFSDGNQGIAMIQPQQGKIVMDGDQLRLNLNEGERAVVYNLKGEQVFRANTSTTFQLGRLQRGVYIVRVGNETRKVMNR